MKHNLKRTRAIKIAFLLDPMEKIHLEWDSSMSLMMEAERRGHRVFYVEPRELFYRDKTIFARAREVSTSRENGFRILNETTLDLKTCDAVFNRKDPPFDMAYYSLTLLLDLLAPHTLVVNSPAGLRKANEKLYILEFPEWIPPTLVSNNPEQILAFGRAHKTDLILKPLDQKGGEGIKLLPLNSAQKGVILRRQPKDLRAQILRFAQNDKGGFNILKPMTHSGTRWIVAQKFLKKNLTHGDKRILLLNGNAIGQFSRIPKAGEYRSNLSLGGKAVRAVLTSKERKLVKALRPKLLRDGLYFVGLDVVDERLIEINVTSPAGFPEINELEGKRPEVLVVDFLQKLALRRRSSR